MNLHSAVFGGSQGNCRLRSFPVPRRAPRLACRLLPLPPLRSRISILTRANLELFSERNSGRFSEPVRETISNAPQPLLRSDAQPSAWPQVQQGRPSRRFSDSDPLAYPLCPFTLLCQNEFKSAISKRIRKCTSRRGVAPHAAEFGTISQQFASPDTKGAFTHYTMTVDGTRTRITHCSSRGLLQLLLYRWIPRYDRSMQRASTQPGGCKRDHL